MRTRLRRLERASRHISEMGEAKAVFLNMIDRLKAIADGRTPPSPHPKADRCQGVYSDLADIRDTGPVEDLSE